MRVLIFVRAQFFLDRAADLWYNMRRGAIRNTIPRGVAQLVARDIWDVDATGSNPVTPTISSIHEGFDL